MNDLSATCHLQMISEATLDRRQDAARLRFLFALLLSTWLPMLFFILVAPLETSSFSIRGIKSIFLFLGTAHVPATLFFYTDKSFSHIVRQHKARYIYFPLALTIASGLLVAFSSITTQAYLFLVFWGWQAFHYGRQNLGIYSFTSIAQHTGAPQKLEKLAIDLATICGIWGTFRILGMGVAPDYLHGTLNGMDEFGKFSYLAVIIFGIYFVIDAGAWRLSKAPQREYMSKRFGFIFKPKDSAKPPLNLRSGESG